ncbi:MAG: hypothetical protein P8Y71_18865, partial [Pseudolabrys sp.]|jgi:hypothetical protein
MTLTRPTRLTQTCAALGLAVAVGLLVVPQAARAGDDNSSSEFYKATFGRLLEGFGLKSADDDAEIHYRERAPLVIPPSDRLPPPEKAKAVPNPAWPKDPDVTRRKRIEKMQKHRDIEAERMREENPLPPDQLAPGPRPRGEVNHDSGEQGVLGRILSPSELGYKGGMFSHMFKGKNDDVAKFTGEPPRTELTEPPPGYQTPSPDQPYGTGKAPAPKADNNYITRSEPEQ